MLKLKSLLLIFVCLICIECLKEDLTNVEIEISSIYDKYIGKKGTIVIGITPSSGFTIEDTSGKAYCNVQISWDVHNRVIPCGLWGVKDGYDKYDSYIINLKKVS